MGRICSIPTVQNTNPQKYGHVIKHLKDSKSIKKDEFPKTLTLGISTLNTQQFSIDKTNKNNKNDNNKDQAQA